MSLFNRASKIEIEHPKNADPDLRVNHNPDPLAITLLAMHEV